MHKCILFWLLLGLFAGSAWGESLGPDAIPWPPEEGVAKAPTRARWFFRPFEPGVARAALTPSEEEVEVALVAELPRFADLWILEADVVDVAAVEARWSTLGTLRRDRSGQEQLLETTRLVSAFNAWTFSDIWGDRTQSVAILDSGADSAHDDLGDPDLDDQDSPPQSAGDADDWVDAGVFGYSKDALIRIVGWHDVSDDMPGHVGPYDYHRHGTAMAGVAFGSGRGDNRYRGVAPEGRFVVVKTYNFEGQWMQWASDLLLGIDWVLAHRDSHRIRAALITTLWDEDLEISDAVNALLDAGIAVIAPSGNDVGKAMGYPAIVPGVITVGASNELGLLANYSVPDPGAAEALDLLAPGGSLIDFEQTVVACDNEPNDSYRGRVGTSIAAAHVAGAASMVLEVLRESGKNWQTTRAQTQWLRELLQITSVEVEGAEPGCPLQPVRNRFGWDPAEGAGLLQVTAALDAVRSIHWPGDLEQLLLDAPRVGPAVWAMRMPLWGMESVRVEMFPPVNANFDLLLYEELSDGFILRDSSTDPGLGRAERVELEHPRSGDYVLVVRRVSGSGLATLQSERILHDDTRWPLQLSSPLVQPPVTADLDGNGEREIIAITKLPIDPSGHTWFVFRPDGRNFGVFPRTHFSTGDRLGDLSAPAIADFGGGALMISGSAFGQVYAVDADAQVAFAPIVSGTAPTTAVAVRGSGSKRILVGTEDGLVVVDASGAVVDNWPIATGVNLEPLLVDLDGDLSEDVVFVEGSSWVHARDIDGNALPGWPVALNGQLPWAAPIAFGDGAANLRVAWTERLASGSSRLVVRLPNGTNAAGFPQDFVVPGGGIAEATAGVIASRLLVQGVTMLAASAWHRDATGRYELAVHQFDPTGAQTRFGAEVITAPALSGSVFQITRRNLGALRSAQMTNGLEFEWILSGQLAWTESEVTQRRRYGSFHALEGRSAVDGEVGRRANFRDGHMLAPAAYAIPPTIDDLDGDEFADILVARDNAIYRQSASVRAPVATGWTRPRADLRRSGCYRCGIDPVVSTPPAFAARLEVQPNPFNPRTTLHWEWPRAGHLQFELFDARGRSVRRWTRSIASAGRYVDRLDARDRDGRQLASGVYRLRMSGGDASIVRSLTLLR